MIHQPASELTVLFADIAGSTRLFDTLGNQSARQLITACLQRLQQITPDHGGTVIKTIGDEVMCTFPTPEQAAAAAVAMHETIAFDPEMARGPIHLRIGFHHGEAVCEADDLYGDAVNMAARMVELAKGDQIITNQATLERLSPEQQRQARMVDRTLVRGKEDIMVIHELSWGKPEQMTMANIYTEEMLATLASETARLVVTQQGRRKIVDHQQPILTLGRGRANHLVIEDRLVSRMHARIELQRNRFVLIDQSTNGTFLQPAGQGTHLLRRESLQLHGQGHIGLGQRITADAPLAIHYRVAASDPEARAPLSGHRPPRNPQESDRF